MEQLKQQEQEWEVAEKIFWKLWSGEELTQEEVEMFKNPNVRRKLARIIQDYPHTYF
jgi:glucuronate isomerase